MMSSSDMPAVVSGSSSLMAALCCCASWMLSEQSSRCDPLLSMPWMVNVKFWPPLAISSSTLGGMESSSFTGWPFFALLSLTGTGSKADRALGERETICGADECGANPSNSRGEDAAEAQSSVPRGVVALDAVASPTSLTASKSGRGEFTSEPNADRISSLNPSRVPSSLGLRSESVLPLDASSFRIFLSMLFTLRYGHRWMPLFRQIFLSEVKHIPKCFATDFSGR
mmetsp:Transcript_49457/g.99170  ORF Transcript_49457/g.99170 Transcript_49457/m.99170 type:complete len:227 (+) Transcript_49457:833-1513(+)